MISPRQSFLAGARGVAPILPGVAPFALVYGVSAVSAGVPAASSVAMSALIFAGASQLALVRLLGEQAPLLVAVATAVLINLRMAMYSASLAPHFAGLPAPWKGLLAYFLTDQAYAVSIARFTRDPDTVDKKWFYLGAGLTMWTTWMAASAAGACLGAATPKAWSLDFAIPLTFIALAFPVIRDVPAALAAGTACLTAVLGQGLPYNLWLPLAAFCGMGAGYAAERRREA